MPVNCTEDIAVAPARMIGPYIDNIYLVVSYLFNNVLKIIGNVLSLYFRFSIKSTIYITAWKTRGTSLNKISDTYNYTY